MSYSRLPELLGREDASDLKVGVLTRAEEGREARVASPSLTASGCDHLEFLEHDSKLQDSQVISSPNLRATINPPRGIRKTNMWKPTLLLAAALAVPSQALHFFMDGAVQKCFYEELPKDTLVVGMIRLSPSTYIRVVYGRC
jgi:hypothetical protein